MNIEIFGAWVAVFLTLAIFSFLYKDNPFYKIAEHLFVGVSAGYWMSMFFWTQIQPNLFGRLWPSSQYSESGVWYRIYDLLGVVAGNVFPDGGIDKGHDLHFIYLIWVMPFLNCGVDKKFYNVLKTERQFIIL